VASGSGRDGSLAIRQDVDLYASTVAPGRAVTHTVGPGRHLWVQVLTGSLDINGRALAAGDGLAASDETAFRFAAEGQGAGLLAFDLA
jgi:redox-sensitive bicupin YhaK (pirin superfamily)